MHWVGGEAGRLCSSHTRPPPVPLCPAQPVSSSPVTHTHAHLQLRVLGLPLGDVRGQVPRQCQRPVSRVQHQLPRAGAGHGVGKGPAGERGWGGGGGARGSCGGGGVRVARAHTCLRPLQPPIGTPSTSRLRRPCPRRPAGRQAAHPDNHPRHLMAWPAKSHATTAVGSSTCSAIMRSAASSSFCGMRA